MAVWGQGDPRWVVESRDDGKNVNGWHWEERNRMEWSRARLTELLVGVTSLDAAQAASASAQAAAAVAAAQSETEARAAEAAASEGGEGMSSSSSACTSSCSYVKVTAVKEISGDAAITTRKGNKRFAMFDLRISLAWEGQRAGEEAQVKGEIKVEEVHSTGDDEDYVYSTSVEGTGAAQDELKRMAEALKPKVYAQIAQFVADITAQA